MGRKTRQKTGAYTTYQATRLAQGLTALRAQQDAYLQTGSAPPDDYSMSRKSQRPAQNTGRTTQDIGDLLQRPMAPKMAASDRTTAFQEEGEQSGAEQEQSVAHPTREPQPNRNNLTPAIKQDIADLLNKMRQMYAAEMDMLRTEMQAVTARTQATEEDVLDLKQEDLAEDRNRRTNLKLRGIADSVDSTELPHYLRRLTATFLPHAQVKKFTLDCFFRIRKARQAPATAPKDVIIQCHSVADKISLLTAVRGKDTACIRVVTELGKGVRSSCSSATEQS
ncbi:Hypothetical predicted protein [Pelobates cultripes]|uniref:Uncharacterized protein n=1 Tax=Pelobates cultripes TaxID=61616 RepID=A0AAD1TPD0_PELCU|nr:Hypothetical predicted protein [Pelobates cultripes]